MGKRPWYCTKLRRVDPQQKEWLSYLPIAPSTEAAVDTPEISMSNFFLYVPRASLFFLSLRPKLLRRSKKFRKPPKFTFFSRHVRPQLAAAAR